MPIDDWLAQNYTEVREQRGWTWAEMADDFDRQGAADLAEWARSLEPEKRATPKRRETATSKPPTPSTDKA